jgi:hypothetical protein
MGWNGAGGSREEDEQRAGGDAWAGRADFEEPRAHEVRYTQDTGDQALLLLTFNTYHPNRLNANATGRTNPKKAGKLKTSRLFRGSMVLTDRNDGIVNCAMSD